MAAGSGREVALAVDGRGHGREARGYLALPRGEAGPAILALHAWWGLNDCLRRYCDRLAAEGYVVLAPDLHDGRLATTIDEAGEMVAALDSVAAARTIDAAISRLLSHHAVTSAAMHVIGFSLGAWYALDAATRHPDDISGVVIYYGSREGDFAPARAAVLGHFAEDDPFEPADGITALEDAIRASGNPVKFHHYPGTGHWFAEDDRPDAYNPAAAHLAWRRTLDFLRG